MFFFCCQALLKDLHKTVFHPPPSSIWLQYENMHTFYYKTHERIQSTDKWASYLAYSVIEQMEWKDWSMDLYRVNLVSSLTMGPFQQVGSWRMMQRKKKYTKYLHQLSLTAYPGMSLQDTYKHDWWVRVERKFTVCLLNLSLSFIVKIICQREYINGSLDDTVTVYRYLQRPTMPQGLAS